MLNLISALKLLTTHLNSTHVYFEYNQLYWLIFHARSYVMFKVHHQIFDLF